MKLLPLFLIVTVVAARSPTRPPSPKAKILFEPAHQEPHIDIRVDPAFEPEPQILIRPPPFSFRRRLQPSWFGDNNVKDAAGCNSSWSTAPVVQTFHTTDHRIYIDTVRHGGSTGDNSDVCVYKPPHVKRKWRECKHKGKRVKCPRGERFEEEEVPGEWILGKGTVGECGQGCCEWNPPENISLFTRKIFSKNRWPEAWYETTTDCQGEKPDLITGPVLMRGLEGQRKSICMEFCKEGGCGTFLQFQGNLRFCTSHCCKLDDIEPVGPPPGRGPMPMPMPGPVPGFHVDPLPPVKIKHGKKHKKHPEKGPDTVEKKEKKTKT